MPEQFRTPKQILDQTNELAGRIYALKGYVIRQGYRFDLATHPEEVRAWQSAVIAQEMLTNTDMDDVLEQIDD